MPETFIMGIGAATWDRFMLVPELPGHEGVTRATATAAQGGGPVATALCALSALGWRTYLIDSQGTDPVGQEILLDLNKWGVDTQGIDVHPDHVSSVAHVMVRENDGARHIFFAPATCAGPLIDAAKKEMIEQASLLHINGRHEEAARHAAGLARSAGVPISFDGGAGRYRDSIRDLVLASDLRILALDFALKFADQDTLTAAAEALLADSPALLVITDGIRGSWIWAGGEAPFHQPAHPVADVVDTTGCGDIFHGAFLHGWLRGWPIQKTSRFAARLAAETARYLGGRTALHKTDLSALEG